MTDICDLLYLMCRLRNKENGCPWDIKQTFRSVAPYTLEEACEVLEAIDRNDYDNLREELGDLLFQVVFHARMAEEARLFNFYDVVASVVEKMVRRHPHVFPDGVLTSSYQGDRISEEDIKGSWQRIKQTEREQQKKNRSVSFESSVLPADLPVTLPSLKKAEKIQKAAAKVGFDWNQAEDVTAKIQEELQEVREAVVEQKQDHIEEEIGDLFFACVAYARHLNVDPDRAVRSANQKFITRFSKMEQRVNHDKKDFSSLSIDEMEQYWQGVKSSED
ncbi:Nucleoside triphosphate pyrophosphohydrolase [invertebrate metagenome]|uniref:Nucleoside triphosphate pyrophosphohydrolase n=1 Tax=invertebrate metagenome TaxID=1711999 RepID=A0A2H9T8C8_9ZZZZ